MALFDQNNYADSMTYFDKALAIDPNYENANNNKRIAQFKMANPNISPSSNICSSSINGRC